MATSGRGVVEVELKILGTTETGITGVIRGDKKVVKILKAAEVTGAWVGMDPGSYVTLRIPTEYAEQVGIISSSGGSISTGGGLVVG